MDDNTILFNGGRALEVTPVDGADQFLSQLLGAAPSKPAIPTLRLVDSPAGERCVGVFIGRTHVGYLENDVDQGLTATLQACEQHGAVARARGTLMASWEEPDTAVLKVDLAESDHLLNSPSSGAPALEAPPPRPVTEPASPSDLQEKDSAPALSAGFTEDYPDWPPPKLQTAQAPPGETAASTEPELPVDPVQTSAQGKTVAPVEPARAPMSNGSAWMGAIPMPGAAPQAGWLSASPSPETGWLAAQNPAPGPGGQVGGTAPAPAPYEGSWQDQAEKPRDPEGQFVTGWTAGATQDQPVADIRTPGMSDRAKAYLIGVLAVVVMAAAGFLVWKTVFAPKTYTDAQYGYSFSYPGRWEFLDESGLFPFTDLAALGAGDAILDLAMAGTGDSLQNMAALGVCLFDASAVPWDQSRFQTDLETNLALAVSQDSSLAIVEPVRAATFDGVPGCRCAISVTSMGLTVTVTYGLLIDGNLGYALMGFAPESSWSDNLGAFEDFFESFSPGATRI